MRRPCAPVFPGQTTIPANGDRPKARSAPEIPKRWRKPRPRSWRRRTRNPASRRWRRAVERKNDAFAGVDRTGALPAGHGRMSFLQNAPWLLEWAYRAAGAALGAARPLLRPGGTIEHVFVAGEE